MRPYRWLWIFVLVVFSVGYSSAENQMNQIKQLLGSKTDFTEKQVENILDLLEKSDIGGLPVEILTNRIKEGVARKSDFPTLLEVLTKKVDSLKQAKELIYECLNKGFSVKDIKYSQQLLAELLERDLSSDDFRIIANLALLQNMKLDELVPVCEVLVRNKEENFPVEYSREIVSLAIVKGLDRKAIEYISETIQEVMRGNALKPDEIKDIILGGLNKHRSVRKIQEAIRETAGRGKTGLEKSAVRRGAETRGEIKDELKQRGTEERQKWEENRGR
ncbi:MAG: hypothetical protein ABIJ11_04525 [Elusimicrobiota bacterium]